MKCFPVMWLVYLIYIIHSLPFSLFTGSRSCKEGWGGPRRGHGPFGATTEKAHVQAVVDVGPFAEWYLQNAQLR